jgi:hypothetical protein
LKILTLLNPKIQFTNSPLKNHNIIKNYKILKKAAFSKNIKIFQKNSKNLKNNNKMKNKESFPSLNSFILINFTMAQILQGLTFCSVYLLTTIKVIMISRRPNWVSRPMSPMSSQLPCRFGALKFSNELDMK